MKTALEQYDIDREEVGLRGKEINYLLDMNREELLEFIRVQETVLCTADALIEEQRTMAKHWYEFHAYLDANEGFREEWDALCMAIKLTEE